MTFGPSVMRRCRFPALAPLLAGIGALLSPNVLLALGLAFAAGGIRLVSSGLSRLERAALATGLAGLGVATWLIATIIGPLPATYAALGDGPIGDPAARMLMLFLSAPITVYLFDWRLNPAAVALLGRVGATLLPAGITLWQGIAMPLALALAAFAWRRRQPALLLVAVGGFGLWSGTLTGQLGGGAVLASHMMGRGDLARVSGVVGFLAVIAGSWQVQFVYTVLLVLIVLVSTIFDSLRPFRPTSAAPGGPQE